MQTVSLAMSPPARLPAVLAALSLLLPLAAAAQENEPIPAAPDAARDVIHERVAELRARILSRIGEVGVAAELFELEEVAALGGSLERVADTFARVAGTSRAHPEVRALARRMLADVERLRGRLPRAEAQLEALGAITEVALVGPFGDENEGGFDTVYGPEESLDLSATYPGLRGDVAWRVVPGLGRTGTLVLHEAVHPSTEVIAYLLVKLDAPRPTSGRLYLGSPGATKAWLNGRAILADDAYRPPAFDQSSVPLALRRGENVLLLKVASGARGPFEVDLRVVGEDGRRIPGLRVEAPAEGSFGAPQRLPAGRRIAGARPLVDPLERAARAGGAQALIDHARVLGERHPHDEGDRVHERAAARAAAAAPGSVSAQLWAARMHDDANERRVFLERAARAESPGRARGHAALAGFWLGEGDAMRALSILAPRLGEAEGDWPARLTLARIYDATGFAARARNVIAEAAERFSDQPTLLHELARRHRSDGETDAAMRRLRVVLGLRPGLASAAAELASLLVDRAKVREADRVLRGASRLHPIDVELLLRRADWLAANEAPDEADALYASAARIAPQAAEPSERHGRALLRRGDTEAALAAFARALEVEPQNAQLRELVRALRPGATSFARPFLHELEAAVAAAEGRWPGEDAVKLVDLTATRVLPSGQASRTVQTIVRVQTPRGVDRFRSFSVRYAPEREQVQVERARIRKADGTIVNAHTESDRSMNEPWSGLYYDARAMVIGFSALEPGDAVELVYRVDDVARDNLLGDYFGDLSYVQDTTPTARWDYVLQMPAGRTIHANEVEGATRSDEALPAGGTLHRWTATDVPKLVPEPGMPGWAEVARYLHVSTYADWESVAAFWWGLVKDQVRPTAEIERVARGVVAHLPASDEAARVRAIYDHVVKNTRYVGLEFGIHSFKPYKVEQVLRRGFGDCKDKASLIHAMLRAVGIESRLVLLRMRHLGAVGEAPASLAIFNHAILYVPSLDLYLDGTAEWSGSRELPESDRGAEVLVVNPGGESRFGRIPEAPADLSLTRSRYAVRLAADGSAALEGVSTISGLPAPGYRKAYASPNGRKAAFEQAWSRTHPGASVTKLELSDLERLEDDVEVRFGLRIPRYAEPSGEGRLAFSPFAGARYAETYAPVSARKHELVLRHAWTSEVRQEYELPSGWEVEALPSPARIESAFGEADVRYEREEGKLVVVSRIRLAVPRVAPAAYGEFRSFLARLDRALSRRIVLAAKGGA